LRGVNVEDFRRLPIPVPPRSEQDRIVDEIDRRLSIVREVEAEVDANLKRGQALRQAVLARAFAGTSLAGERTTSPRLTAPAIPDGGPQ
jgi:type I restriction enzyme S subunit